MPKRRREYVRGMRIRLLEDRVLQNVAWTSPTSSGGLTRLNAEYFALTRLQADALIRLDRQLAEAVKDLVTVVPIEALFSPEQTW